ncbi:MAG TPA: response regulator transcription factor [Bacillota bacterium]|nr:response regulator transcription factor [Bacillota bacterium]
MPKVLVIEDEKKIVQIIQAYLVKEGYEVVHALDGEHGLSLFQSEKPDLIILDLMLPKKSGEQICVQIRQLSDVPIIILSAKCSEEERIFGLKIGADDYLTKPFSPSELTARVETVLRRSRDASPRPPAVSSLSFGEIRLDPIQLQVRVNDQPLHLTPTEFRTLQTLMKVPGQVFTRAQLTETVQGYNYDGYDRAIDSHIKNLRQKIAQFATREYIQTVHGFGYKFGGGSD